MSVPLTHTGCWCCWRRCVGGRDLEGVPAALWHILRRDGFMWAVLQVSEGCPARRQPDAALNARNKSALSAVPEVVQGPDRG